MSEQTPGQKIDAALAKLKDAAASAGVIGAAQGALGWMIRGDMDKAATVLARLPADELVKIAAAAATLSGLAASLDMRAGRRPPT